jgi:hypothetical protein
MFQTLQPGNVRDTSAISAGGIRPPPYSRLLAAADAHLDRQQPPGVSRRGSPSEATGLAGKLEARLAEAHDLSFGFGN